MTPHRAAGNAAIPEAPGPSQSPSRGRLRRPTRRTWAVAGIIVVLVAAVLGHVPAFYRGCRMGTAEDGRRLISQVAALGSAIGRPGAWSLAATEAHINGWLRNDLPRNHASLLPSGISDARVALAPGLVRAGARVGWGPVAAVASAAVSVERLDAGRLRADVRSVRLGGLPLPHGPVIHRLVNLAAAAGVPTELQRLDGRTVVVVYISAAGDPAGKTHRLDSLAIRDGELLFAGETTVAGDRRR